MSRLPIALALAAAAALLTRPVGLPEWAIGVELTLLASSRAAPAPYALAAGQGVAALGALAALAILRLVSPAGVLSTPAASLAAGLVVLLTTARVAASTVALRQGRSAWALLVAPLGVLALRSLEGLLGAGPLPASELGLGLALLVVLGPVMSFSERAALLLLARTLLLGAPELPALALWTAAALGVEALRGPARWLPLALLLGVLPGRSWALIWAPLLEPPFTERAFALVFAQVALVLRLPTPSRERSSAIAWAAAAALLAAALIP